MKTLTIIKADGTTETQTVAKAAEYDAINKAVGGFIEAVPHFEKYQGRKCDAFVNEEGRLLDLPLNPQGTKLWLEAMGYGEGKPIPEGTFWYKPEVFGTLVIVQTERKAA